MPLIDDIKKERESMKSKTFKEKWDYFWYYYKIHVIVTFCIIVVTIFTIHDITTSKEIAFYIAFLNAIPSEDDSVFADEFAKQTDIDLDEYKVYLDTSMSFNVKKHDENSMASTQKFLVMASANEMDVVVTYRDIFSTYADNGAFRDLRNYLTEEQIEKYSDYFYYFDENILENQIDVDAVTDSALAIPTDTTERRDPSLMEKPIPVGIFLDDTMNDKLTESGYFTDSQELVFGIMAPVENKVYCQQFIDWLLETAE